MNSHVPWRWRLATTTCSEIGSDLWKVKQRRLNNGVLRVLLTIRLGRITQKAHIQVERGPSPEDADMMATIQIDNNPPILTNAPHQMELTRMLALGFPIAQCIPRRLADCDRSEQGHLHLELGTPEWLPYPRVLTSYCHNIGLHFAWNFTG